MAQKEIYAPLQKILYLQQDKATNHWDAKGAFDDDYKTLNYDAGVSQLKRGIIQNDTNPTSRSSLLREKDRIITDKYSALKTFNFSHEISYKDLARHLVHSVLGVTEDEATPYKKVFSPPFVGSNPFVDFTNNEGFLASIGVQNYGSGSENDSFILYNAILDSYEMVMDLTGEGLARFLKASGEWKGTAVDDDSQDNAGFTGTLAAKVSDGYFNKDANSIIGLNLYSPASDAITYQGLMRRFTFKINNNAFSDAKALSPGNLKVAPSYQAIIDIPFVPGLTTQIKKKFHNGDFFAFEVLTKALADTDAGYLSYNCGRNAATKYNFLLTDEPDYYEGDYVALRLQGDCIYDPADAGGAGNPFDITLVDAIDGGY